MSDNPLERNMYDLPHMADNNLELSLPLDLFKDYVQDMKSKTDSALGIINSFSDAIKNSRAQIEAREKEIKKLNDQIARDQGIKKVWEEKLNQNRSQQRDAEELLKIMQEILI